MYESSSPPYIYNMYRPICLTNGGLEKRVEIQGEGNMSINYPCYLWVYLGILKVTSMVLRLSLSAYCLLLLLNYSIIRHFLPTVCSFLSPTMFYLPCTYTSRLFVYVLKRELRVILYFMQNIILVNIIFV